ncbi:MAG TPA: Xaa-Pro peptidase family protein [Terriglobales bacterium]|nr:Xaa-Pro peptidase family protein [Terriglobales bacterium]
MRDPERIERVRRALEEAQLDALVCALPLHVLLLSGYWPVVGLSLAIATREGRIVLLVPEDEQELVTLGWADEVHTFRPASLSELRSLADVVRQQWQHLAGHLGLAHARLGFELGPVSEPASYVAVNLYGSSLEHILRSGAPLSQLSQADEMLATLAASKTRVEIDRIRHACRLAATAFESGFAHIKPGLVEAEAASLFRRPLSANGSNRGASRADGFVFCMSGENSALASGAYARSRNRSIRKGDLVLVHCNSYVDGYWTDITRTYCAGEMDQKKTEIYDAVMHARVAALSAIKPGVEARQVDQAARNVLKARGYEKEFKHSTGHGVGFAAISPNARPQIHPKSHARLLAGMIFNVEPAVYIDNYGGVRHCDMVAVTDSGYELLTPFHNDTEKLVFS